MTPVRSRLRRLAGNAQVASLLHRRLHLHFSDVDMWDCMSTSGTPVGYTAEHRTLGRYTAEDRTPAKHTWKIRTLPSRFILDSITITKSTFIIRRLHSNTINLYFPMSTTTRKSTFISHTLLDTHTRSELKAPPGGQRSVREAGSLLVTYFVSY